MIYVIQKLKFAIFGVLSPKNTKKREVGTFYQFITKSGSGDILSTVEAVNGVNFIKISREANAKIAYQGKTSFVSCLKKPCDRC